MGTKFPKEQSLVHKTANSCATQNSSPYTVISYHNNIIFQLGLSWPYLSSKTFIVKLIKVHFAFRIMQFFIFLNSFFNRVYRLLGLFWTAPQVQNPRSVSLFKCGISHYNTRFETVTLTLTCGWAGSFTQVTFGHIRVRSHFPSKPGFVKKSLRLNSFQSVF